MTDERVWLTHPETGGYFHCPKGAERDWTTPEMGWVVANEPPPEENPVVAELLAAQARQAADQAANKTGRKRGTDTPQEG